MAKGTINKVILVGRLGSDPELKTTTSGTAVTNFSLATNEGYKDQQTGKFNDIAEWHKVTCFNKLAEIAGQYLQKGKQVYIEGRLKTTKWQDSQGNDRYTTGIIANEMQILGGKDSDQAPTKIEQENQKMKEFLDDDIPF